MRKSDRKLELVTKSDARFFPGLLAMLGSLNASGWQNYTRALRILDYGLSQSQLEQIRRLGKNISLNISFERPVNIDLHPRGEELGWYNESIFGLLQPSLFSQGHPDDDVIAVDADILFISKPKELFSFDSQTLFGSPDFPPLDLRFQIYGNSVNDYEILPDYKLDEIAFNAGFLAAKRSVFQKLQKKSMKFQKFASQIYTNDQGILNLALSDSDDINLQLLPQTYNWRPKFNRAKNIDQISQKIIGGNLELNSSYFGNIFICHFCGQPKPWERPDASGRKIWEYYYDIARLKCG